MTNRDLVDIQQRMKRDKEKVKEYLKKKEK